MWGVGERVGGRCPGATALGAHVRGRSGRKRRRRTRREGIIRSRIYQTNVCQRTCHYCRTLMHMCAHTQTHTHTHTQENVLLLQNPPDNSSNQCERDEERERERIIGNKVRNGSLSLSLSLSWGPLSLQCGSACCCLKLGVLLCFIRTDVECCIGYRGFPQGSPHPSFARRVLLCCITGMIRTDVTVECHGCQCVGYRGYSGSRVNFPGLWYKWL